MMGRTHIMLALLTASSASAPLASLGAQTMRAFSASRPASGERQLRASIDFAAGAVQVRPAGDKQLYGVRMKYDADRFAPIQQYDARVGILRLGLESVGKGGMRVTSRSQLEQTAVFEFSPSVPLALTAHLGASEGTLELGGLALTELTVRGGASRSTVSFSRPTRGECRSATFGVGATEVKVERLANAGCAQVRVEGGVGRAVLDFRGTWRRNAQVSVDLAMGTLTLRIPRGTGVQLVTDRFLSPIDATGLERVGKTWSTPQFDKAARQVTVQLKAAMVGVQVEWVD